MHGIKLSQPLDGRIVAMRVASYPARWTAWQRVVCKSQHRRLVYLKKPQTIQRHRAIAVCRGGVSHMK